MALIAHAQLRLAHHYDLPTTGGTNGRSSSEAPRRERVELQRHAASRDHAALDRLGDSAQAQVAVVQLAPGVGDANYRLAGEKLARLAQCSEHRPALWAKFITAFEPFRAA
jgi:hypothetical protein